MKLKITFKEDIDDQILSLPEEEWQFSVRFGSRNDSDNLLLISNSLYNMTNGQYIINFFKNIKDIDYENFNNIQLLTNDDILLFDSLSLGFYYSHMYLDYKYNSNMMQIGFQDRGLTYGFAFRAIMPEQSSSNVEPEGEENPLEEE